MSKHEFGIMQKSPSAYERFDRYEPEKYNCITVDDDLIEPILSSLDNVGCYWHTIQKPGKGLAYCGITLIPPKSAGVLINILRAQSRKEYDPLIALVGQAHNGNHYIIHFGV
jgi:hypothetical protein